MAAASESAPPEAALVQGIRRHLEGLKRTADGAALYMLIERGLKRYAGDGGRMEQAFLRFMHSLLDRYASDRQNDPVTRVKARLIVQRVALHLPDAQSAPPPVPPRTRVSPAARAVSVDPKAAPPESAAAASADPKPARDEQVKPGPAPLETLADKVTETVTFNKEFDALVQREGHTLGRVDDAVGDFSDLKQLLVKGLDELIRERAALRKRLTTAAQYAKSVEADRQQLRAELGMLRKHSLADELTGLPKREAFVRSLEGELARVRRYGFSLALAVLDVDGLETVNHDYGRAAGDAVLRCYATEVLSGFRSYDLVARYGGDEFAVLFPNTQKEGAMRALEKAQKRASETYLTHEGKSFPLPRFSSVLALHAPGEKAAVLLARASEALDRAKHAGLVRMVFALPTA